jgi:hypothetical protein
MIVRHCEVIDLLSNGTIVVNGVNLTVPSPNRFVSTEAVAAPANPIDNQRFFVWQHYADFLTGQPEPDEGGLNFWTTEITRNCATGFNVNTHAQFGSVSMDPVLSGSQLLARCSTHKERPTILNLCISVISYTCAARYLIRIQAFSSG